MRLEWLDGSITPSLSNTNQRLLVLRTNGAFTFGIYSCPDGWFDILEGKEIDRGLIDCYARLIKPVKKIQEIKNIIWE